MVLYWLMWCLNRGRTIYRRWCCSTARIWPSTQPISKLRRIDRMQCPSMFPFGMHSLDLKNLDVRGNLFHRNQNQSNVFDIGRGRPDSRGIFHTLCEIISVRRIFAIMIVFFLLTFSKSKFLGCVAISDVSTWKMFDCRKRMPFICELKPSGPSKRTVHLNRKCSLKRPNNFSWKKVF